MVKATWTHTNAMQTKIHTHKLETSLFWFPIRLEALRFPRFSRRSDKQRKLTPAWGKLCNCSWGKHKAKEWEGIFPPVNTRKHMCVSVNLHCQKEAPLNYFLDCNRLCDGDIWEITWKASEMQQLYRNGERKKLHTVLGNKKQKTISKLSWRNYLLCWNSS